MATQTVKKSDTLYLNIVGGSMVEKSDEDNPDARRRDYEDSKGNKGTKWEIAHRNLTGVITDIRFEKTDFGTQVRVQVTDDEEKVTLLSFPYESDYFDDFAKRICGADLTKEVTLNPYSMEVEGKKYAKKGISIKQFGEKLQNHFYDGKKNLHGFPEVSDADRKKYDTDDWKLFFGQCRSFLKKQVQGLKVGATPGTPQAKEQKENIPFLKGRAKK